MDAQGRQVLSHGDPEGDLEKLFAAVMNKKEGQPVSVPMRMRNLPPSFFNPPPDRAKGGASAAAYPGPPPTSQLMLRRELEEPHPKQLVAGSGEETSSCPPAGLDAVVTASDKTEQQKRPMFTPDDHKSGWCMSPHNLPIAHSRAHSSPASLQATQQASAQQFQHLRQQSYDPTAMDDLGPLPPGWEMAHTASGQRYYLNRGQRKTVLPNCFLNGANNIQSGMEGSQVTVQTTYTHG
ncbi:DNA-binding transcription factor yap1 [Branchiostoma belcheri]|nr:DNA-binding transcription factor yap1 [Branchiostoma belcheri]